MTNDDGMAEVLKAARAAADKEEQRKEQAAAAAAAEQERQRVGYEARRKTLIGWAGQVVLAANGKWNGEFQLQLNTSYAAWRPGVHAAAEITILFELQSGAGLTLDRHVGVVDRGGSDYIVKVFPTEQDAPDRHCTASMLDETVRGRLQLVLTKHLIAARA